MKHLFEKPRLRKVGRNVWLCVAKAKHRPKVVEALGRSPLVAYASWLQEVNALHHVSYMFEDPELARLKRVAIEQAAMQRPRTFVQHLMLRPENWS